MGEQEAVEDSEFVYRRIAPMYYDARLALPIQREAFRPSHNDSTGLSVLRANFAQPLDTLANLDPAKAQGYCVARLSVRDLPDPLPGGPPGHAIIPELSWAAYQAHKGTCKPILVELAKLASADVVHRTS
jgi:hypothetical protein